MERVRETALTKTQRGGPTANPDSIRSGADAGVNRGRSAACHATEKAYCCSFATLADLVMMESG